jgi:hypothetical protein
LIPDLLGLLPRLEIARKIRFSDQSRWHLNSEERESSVECFSAPGMHQSFQGAQCDRGTGVHNWYPGFVPASGVLCGAFAAESLRFFGVFTSGNLPGAKQVLSLSTVVSCPEIPVSGEDVREPVKTRHAQYGQEGGRLPSFQERCPARREESSRKSPAQAC